MMSLRLALNSWYVVTSKMEMIDEPHFAHLPHTFVETEEGAERLFLHPYCALRLRPHVEEYGQALACLKSCPKTATYRSLRSL
jgi:hypothetical protein